MKFERMTFCVAATMIFAVMTASNGNAQSAKASLEEGFKHPPDSAKPRAWWHWMSGNVTEAGITADLEWMRRVGIAGMQMFDGDMGAPLYVDKPVIWMSPEWKSAWHHAASEADRLHLEMSMAASGGWSETAGPWVRPEQGMKKYVWSETVVEGPGAFKGALKHPPTTVGKFQDLAPAPPRENHPDLTLPGAHPQPPLPKAAPTPEFYRDAAVVAFRAPADEAASIAQKPVITCSCGAIDAAKLSDGSFSQIVEIPYSSEDHTAWVQFEYANAQPVQSILFGGAAGLPFSGPVIPNGRIEASDDGGNWRTLMELPGAHGVGSVNIPVRTFAIAPAKARFYRLYFKATPPDPLRPPPAGTVWPAPVRLTEVQFHAEPRVRDWEDKASFGIYTPTTQTQGDEVQKGEAIDPSEVIDLTGKMHADGTLDWDAPAGRWIVLRLGYSLTGEVNHPATPAATGLEVDKLSRTDVQSYVEQYVKMISSAAGPLFGKSFRYFLMDSWEAGQENWTEDMLSEFEHRRAYSMTRYLPVLTGRIVGTRAQSEAFLWDFRRTQADMLAENHYAAATKYFAKFGVGLYAEAMGTNMPTTGDGLLNKGQVTIPMGEFWTPLPNQKDTPAHIADVMEAASAAHIYGKPIAATESFTTRPNVTPWGQSPFYLKPLADQDFARGINRIVFHTSDLQPFVDNAHKPGMTLGPYGQDYTRNITWAEQAVAWNTYLARCSFLLQQGKPVSDIAYFYGEDAPATVPFWKKFEPALPAHYNFDFVNADVLLHGAAGTLGNLHLASGITYRLLVLPEDLRNISVPLLRSIHSLVQQGAVLLGPKPEDSPSLADGPDAKREIGNLANDLWGFDSEKIVRGHVFGKGKVYSGMSIEDVLEAEKLGADFSWSTPQQVSEDVPYSLPGADSNEDLLFIHRHEGERDIYFVSTQKHHGFDVRATFRVAGKQPRLWHPDTGEIEATSFVAGSGTIEVPLHFDAEGSVFVVFEPLPSAHSHSVPVIEHTALATIGGGWKVSFPAGTGAPPNAEFPNLTSWTNNADAGVKYFSGSATYEKQIEIKRDWLKPGARLMLDLGTVKEMAEVGINGTSVGGIQWKPPFVVDITSVVHPGMNVLRIKVTNLWPNRMIGDLQPGVTKTYTWTDFRPFKPESPLLESGLLGPVTLSQAEESSK